MVLQSLWNDLQNFLHWLFHKPPAGMDDTCDLSSEPGCFTKGTLDELARIRNVPRYNWNEWKRISDCLQQQSTDELPLLEANDVAWQGLVDLWLNATDGSWAKPGAVPFAEFNPVPLQGSVVEKMRGVIVAEQCNSLSNIANYRAAVEICDTSPSFANTPALVLGMASLAFGSSLFHISRTLVGGVVDNIAINVVAWNIHTNALRSLPYDPLLFDLQETAPNLTAVEAPSVLWNVFYKVPAVDWLEAAQNLEIPFYPLVFGAFVIVTATIIFDVAIGRRIATLMADLLLGEFPEERDFVLNEFFPKMETALDALPPAPFKNRVELFLQGLGTTLKMMFAFIWQEVVLGDVLPIADNAIINQLGGKLGFLVVILSNKLTGYHRRDLGIQLQKDVYPDDASCRQESAHSKWHELAANGLVDMMYLAESVHQVLQRKSLVEVRTELPCPVDTEQEDIVGFAECVIGSQSILVCARDCIGEANPFLCFVDCGVATEEIGIGDNDHTEGN